MFDSEKWKDHHGSQGLHLFLNSPARVKIPEEMRLVFSRLMHETADEEQPKLKDWEIGKIGVIHFSQPGSAFVKWEDAINEDLKNWNISVDDIISVIPRDGKFTVFYRKE